jgi:hypothetical protein
MIIITRAETYLIQVKQAYLWGESSCVVGVGLFHYQYTMPANDNL